MVEIGKCVWHKSAIHRYQNISMLDSEQSDECIDFSMIQNKILYQNNWEGIKN